MFTEDTRLLTTPSPDNAGEVWTKGFKGLKGLLCVRSLNCPYACICFPCAMQKEQHAGPGTVRYCTPDLCTWLSEGGWLAAQTAWRKDSTIKDGWPTCLSALLCTTCYLSHLLDIKKTAQLEKRREGQGKELLRPVDSQPGPIRF